MIKLSQTTLRSSLGALLAAFAVGCSSAPEAPTSPSESSAQTDVDDPLAAVVQRMTPLATTCTFSGGVMTVTVAAGETAIISKRPTDSAIVQNGVACTTPVLASTLKKVAITGSSGDETVIIDYTNGLFATGSTSPTSGITVDMGGSAGADVFGIRGQNSATAKDTVTFGASGVAVNTDVSKDITFTTEPDSYIVSLADGADTFSAAGGAALGVGGVYAGAKPLVLWGGAGDDTFAQGTVPTPGEEIHGGTGSDTVSYALRPVGSPVTVTVGAGTSNDGDVAGSGEGDDVKNDIEVLTGGDGADTLTAAPAVAITLNGGKAIDTLTGSSAADTINGNDGNDLIAGLDGADTLNGNEGNDTFDEGTDANGGDIMNGGAGTDTVDYSARTVGVTVTMDGALANDGKTGANENDNVKADVENILGSDLVDTITGNLSANVITGNLGGDTLNGGDGDDTFDMGLDLSSGDSDSDVISGGNGVDLADYSARTADLTITLDNAADSGDHAVGIAEMDKLDCENVTTGDGDDTVTGNSGPNEITGGAGGDTLDGAEGDDILDGQTGTNTLDCGAGDGDIGFNGTATNCEF